MEYFLRILQLPERCLVNKKITKVFFKRNFNLKPADRRLLDDFNLVIGIDWLASINPKTTNILKFEGENQVFEEIQVIALQTTQEGLEKNFRKISDLIQRYIPYPILLFIYSDDSYIINAADKRLSMANSSERIVEKQYYSLVIPIKAPDDLAVQFIESIAFPKLDKMNLKTFYESYINRLISFQVAQIHGIYNVTDTSTSRLSSQQIEKIESLERELKILWNKISSETQLKRQVEINLEIQGINKQIQEIKSSIM